MLEAVLQRYLSSLPMMRIPLWVILEGIDSLGYIISKHRDKWEFLTRSFAIKKLTTYVILLQTYNGRQQT